MKTKHYILGCLALGALAAVNSNHNTIIAQDTVRKLDEVIIRDTRASQKAPLTTTTLNRAQLDELHTETSVPYMIELQTSVVATMENCQSGNTYMRIRGVDASRINVNINGITLNDPESHAVFWVNLPNLGGMAQSLQIQRGVGASTSGSAFGAAINLQTLNSPSAPYGYADLSYGTWNTRQYTIGAGTGLTSKGFAFDVNYTGLTSDGFIRNGGSDQQSVFLNGAYYGERTFIKALAIIGKQKTGITWNGAYASELDEDKHFNSAGLYYDELGNKYYYGNETDNYTQQHYQIYINQTLSDLWSINGAFDYTRGDGYDENFRYNKKGVTYGVIVDGDRKGRGNFITKRSMANNAYTFNLGTRYEKDRLQMSLGENVLIFDGAHFGDVLWSKTKYIQDTRGIALNLDRDAYEWYNYNGNKIDATTFLKLNYDLSDRINLYADLQYRFVNYRIEGIDDNYYTTPYDIDFEANYHFFNPKAGVNWAFADGQRTYFVAGISHREPTYADILDKIEVGDTIKAEAMLDLELGYKLERPRYSIGANIYAMLYRNQLTPSGNLSNEGYALMENVDKSFRLGIELEAGYRFTDWLKLDANLTLSRNRIIDYTYTNGIDITDTSYITITENTNLSFSPSVVGAVMATIEPIKDLKLRITGKYVGQMYGDNTSRDVYKQDAYFLLNCSAGYTWHLGGTREIEAQLVARNMLNHEYRTIAWVGDWDDGANYYNDIAFFQQPGINFTGRMIFRF